MALPKDVQALLDKMEPDIRKAFLDAIQRITSQAQLKAIIGHLEAGNIDAAIAALRVDPVFFQPLDRAIREAFYQGGVLALAALPKIPDPFGVAQRFLGSMEITQEPLTGDDSTSDD